MVSTRSDQNSVMSLTFLFSCALLTPVVPVRAETPDRDSATQTARHEKIVVVGRNQKLTPLHKTKTSYGAFGERSDLDTPFSQAQFTDRYIAEKVISSTHELFQQDASIMSNAGTYTSRPSLLSVRGLQLDTLNSYKINGLALAAYGLELPLEDFQQVDVLKGPAGFMYGFGSPGGIVNYVTKKPTDQFYAAFDQGYQTNSVFSEHLDVGGRFFRNKRVGYRVNLTHEGGETFNGGSIDRNAFSLGLDVRITDKLTWTFDGLYQRRVTTGGIQGLLLTSYTGSGLPGTISGRRNLSSNGSQYASEGGLLVSGLHWDMAPGWKASLDYSYSSTRRRYAEDTLLLLNRAGGYSDYMYDVGNRYGFHQIQGLGEGHFTTGPFKHYLVFGATWQSGWSDFATPNFYNSIGTGNLFSRNANVYRSSISPRYYRGSTVDQTAGFLSDTIALTRWMSVLGGVRYTDLSQTSRSSSGVVTARYGKSPFTPTVALLIKPRADTTVYFSWVQALEQGTTVGTTYRNANAVLPPIVSTQYEVGVKAEHKTWTANAALFRIDRANSYVNSSNYYVQSGMAQYDGVELGASLQPVSSLRLSANLMWLDASVISGVASQVGRRVRGASRFTATGGVDWSPKFLKGFVVNGQGRYTGTTAVGNNSALTVPAYALFDLGALYGLDVGRHRVELRTEIRNIADRRYWYYYSSSIILPGEPRTFAMSLHLGY
ncbi:TonB-dependent siderophore receptor [Acetobacter sp. DsW_063]|uniref:TonB-dependent siderophore receptor n=1 Tax=Acetobacter sp. DsW_063 TaxID=1514894 RepID=UPI000A3D4D11|nr:TonB-dependent receptor [Acetobacter sp. DsW_063]